MNTLETNGNSNRESLMASTNNIDMATNKVVIEV